VLEDKTYGRTDEPNPGVAVVKNALFDKQQGKNDGYFMIVEWKEPATAPGTKPDLPKAESGKQ
jgi:hypothetical protein